MGEFEGNRVTLSERRLAAVMFTDMVGYTALGQKNEPLSLVLVEEQRKIVRPILASNRGREVKTIGDGLLVEFPSALEAVSCATKIQTAMSDRNLTVPLDRRMSLRIAVHLGDVEHAQGDIFGDAVNVASRVLAFSDPGGICITGQVYDHIRNRKEFGTEPLGKRELKNVLNPVELYKVLLPRGLPVVAEMAVEPTRIAALPLRSISSEPQDEYFADGLTEEIINTLSSISGVHVIARTSVMKYKGVSRTIGEIGRELKVGTVLEGSVRKSGGRLRVTVQLVDAGSEEPLWAQKYDRNLEDVFAIQTEIAEKVADALKAQFFKDGLRRIENRAPENIEAYTLYLRGRYQWNKRTKEGLESAVEYFKQAIQHDPEYALAYAGMADCYTLMGRHAYQPSEEAYSKAREFANRALQIDDKLAEAHASLAAVLMNGDLDWKGAEEQIRLALSLNPNYATARYWYSILLQTIGKLDQAITESEKAQLLDPLSPIIGMGMVQAYLASGQYDRGIDECKKYLDLDESFLPAHDYLVHLFVQKRMFDDAVREAQRMIELNKGEGKIHLAYAFAASGRTQKARRLIEESREDVQSEHVGPIIFVILYAVLGELDEAFKWAGKMSDSHRPSFLSLRFSPDLEQFRKDDRYRELLVKAGLESHLA